MHQCNLKHVSQQLPHKLHTINNHNLKLHYHHHFCITIFVRKNTGSVQSQACIAAAATQVTHHQQPQSKIQLLLLLLLGESIL
jgi:hypothetical protein